MLQYNHGKGNTLPKKRKEVRPMTTNKKNGAWFDYLAQSLVCSKQFLVRAGQFGTPEFHQLMDMRSKQPTFTVVEYKPERKTEKKVIRAGNPGKIHDIKNYL